MTTMTKLFLVSTLALAPGLAMAGGQSGDSPGRPGGTTWGDLTAGAITSEDGFDQGAHSSDPSGDGQGPGTSDEPRAGLANVVEQGDMRGTIEFIKAILD